MSPLVLYALPTKLVSFCPNTRRGELFILVTGPPIAHFFLFSFPSVPATQRTAMISAYHNIPAFARATTINRSARRMECIWRMEHAFRGSFQTVRSTSPRFRALHAALSQPPIKLSFINEHRRYMSGVLQHSEFHESCHGICCRKCCLSLPQFKLKPSPRTVRVVRIRSNPLAEV